VVDDSQDRPAPATVTPLLTGHWDARPRRRPRVLLITEGTYPYAIGGVSSWCDLLLRNLTEIDWQVLPIVAAHGRPPVYVLPPHAEQVGRIELWSEELPHGRYRGRDRDQSLQSLPDRLVRGLISWDADLESLTDALVWCRANPAGVRKAFRSDKAWERFLIGLREVLDEHAPGSGTPPDVDLVEAASLYQMLYWVARTAVVPTPETDVLHVTAAGWASIPAIVHKRLHGTPMVVTEHGVYVREAYLAAVRGRDSPGGRFVATRLARGLARAAYDAADVVSPVTEANAVWEQGLGVDPEKILVLRNGMQSSGPPQPPPKLRTVVSVGRIDPLKDVHTMLRVADETLDRVPDATFLHFGPVMDGEEAYARSCSTLHTRLGLGSRFRFMGRTTDPNRVIREADVVLMTSISEGLPMSILEAMSEARPVVSTGVGGVPDVVKGCGIVTAPGDTFALSMGVTTLLRNPDLAWRLGRRGHRRLHRVFDEAFCLDGYRELLITAAHPGARTAGTGG
jgi:glycosyltransferase involved in cell wall biosynthesis